MSIMTRREAEMLSSARCFERMAKPSCTGNCRTCVRRRLSIYEMRNELAAEVPIINIIIKKA